METTPALSIILPYYKRYQAFKQATALNSTKQTSVSGRETEIVLVLDEPTEERPVLELVSSYTEISWRVLINRRDHLWRNPAVAINVGIRHAEGKYVLIMSPESIYVSDVPGILQQSCALLPDTFAVGRIVFYERSMIGGHELVSVFDQGRPNLYYGSICVAREALEKIGGYDEANETWGGDDDNIRERLLLSGLEIEYIPAAQVIHPRDNNPRHGPLRDIKQTKTPNELQDCVMPRQAIANGRDWGREFDEIIYDYRSATYRSPTM